MEFRFAQGPIGHPHRSYPFQFTPTSASIHFAKFRLYPNTRPGGDDFNVGDLSREFEFHSRIVTQKLLRGKATYLPHKVDLK